MIKKINISNFRSIKHLEFEIKPLTVIYGKNASGKSSILYPFLLIKNIVLNPNQQLVNFFNFQFINLGGFEQVIFNHDSNSNIEIMLSFEKDIGEVIYGVALGLKENKFHLKFKNISETLPISFPYSLNANKQLNVSKIDRNEKKAKKLSETLNKFDTQREITLLWNGITVQPSGQINEEAQTIMKQINSMINDIKGIDFIPLNRGFTKPIFSPVSVSPFAINQDEVASLIIINNGYLEGKIHIYCKKIFNKDFRTYSPPGATTFFLRTIDESGFVSELVNDGFGVNQTIYMLTKILRPETKLVFIEEPEIHLHPSAQSKLVKAFIEIIKGEEKQVVVSTHSEVFVSAILAKIEEKKISPNDVAFYLCERKEGQTVLKRQNINEHGQVEGGLISFMESQIEDLKAILGVKNNEEGNNN